MNKKSFILGILDVLYSNGEPEKVIQKALEKIGQYVNASRVYIFEYFCDGCYLDNVFEWCGEGVKPQIQNRHNLDIKDDFSADFILKKNGILEDEIPGELPEKWNEMLAKQQVKSIFWSTVYVDNTQKGLIGCDFCEKQADISQDVKQDLTAACILTGQFFYQKRQQIETNEKLKLMDHMEQIIYVIDKEFNIQYCNETTIEELKEINKKNLIKSDKKKLMHGKCYERFMKRDKPCKDCPVFMLSGTRHTALTENTNLLNKRLIISASKITWEKQDGYVISCKDITQLLNEHDEMMMLHFMNENIGGGIRSVYNKPGYPLCDINYSMLEYMGYSSKEEYIKDIKGMFINSVHPDEREYIHNEIEMQLKKQKTYNVEYRLRKKDGTFLWMRETGKRSMPKGGEETFISVGIDISEKKKVQEELKVLTDTVAGGIVQYEFREKQMLYRYVNEGMAKILGYSVKEYQEQLKKCPFSCAYKEDRADLIHKVKEGAETLCPINRNYRGVKKDGQIIWLNVHINFVKENQEVTVGYAVFMDITEQIEEEEKAKQRYEEELAYLSSIESEQTDCMKINVSTGIVEQFSDKISDDKAVPGQMSIDMAVDIFQQKMINSKSRENCARVMNQDFLRKTFDEGESQITFDYLSNNVITKNPVWMQLMIKLIRVPYSEDLVAFVTNKNIDDKKIMEEIITRIVETEYDYISYIEENSEYYKVFLLGEKRSNLPRSRGIYSEILEEVNQQYVLEEEKQKYIENMSLKKVFKELKKAESYSYTYRAVESGHISTKKMTFRYLNKERKLIMLIRSDITELINAESERNQAMQDALMAAQQASVAKTDFLSRMSHEIRTPMNAIIGLTALASQDIDKPAALSDSLSKIGISARFLLSLINDILDMSRIESGKMMLMDSIINFEEFVEGINTIIYPQAEEKGIDYETIVKGVVEPAYIGDVTKLQQVLINILGNSLKFTSKGGKIQFMIEQVKRTGTEALMRFVINDTGKGISEEFLPHLFDTFSQEEMGTTSSYGGTGLGLAICKNLVNMMNGRIDVRSVQGIGTEFTVELKLKVTDERVWKNPIVTNHNLKNMKVLIVDDDVIICQHTELIFKNMGMKAEWVDSGLKAVKTVKSNHQDKKDYDIILIDWKMPGMDGIQTAEYIREIVGSDITIIIMTAYEWTQIEEKGKCAGIDYFMKKPLFISSISNMFEQIFSEKEHVIHPKSINQIDFTGKRVLLAEDHPMNVEIATKLLESRGMEVHTAENGLKAIEKYMIKPDFYFNAILMDIRMPVMDGLTAAKAIRHLEKPGSKTIPIIAMTANAFAEDVEKSKEAGMNEHLAKPIEPLVLYTILEKYMNDNEKYRSDNEKYVGDNEKYVGDNEKYRSDNEKYVGDNEKYVGDNEKYVGDNEKCRSDNEK